ncbi:MAG: hypothetical protein GY785_06475 [Gammaproteobacteria bacterium]|nr:hypothetical protein [Gammaproteobacteria bacterium]
MTSLRRTVFATIVTAISMLLIAPQVNATDLPSSEVQADAPQTAPAGCSACDARKQQQVKARQERKKQQEQAAQVDPD